MSEMVMFEPSIRKKPCIVCGVLTANKTGFCSTRCQVLHRQEKRARKAVRGEKTLSVPVPTEHEEQKMLFEWWERTQWHKQGIVMAAIPNGGLRNVITAKRLKAEGVIAGMPDILLCAARGGYHGLFIEMKRTKGGKLSEAQRSLHGSLRWAGYAVNVCKGFDYARQIVEMYLNGELTNGSH